MTTDIQHQPQLGVKPYAGGFVAFIIGKPQSARFGQTEQEAKNRVYEAIRS